MNDPDDPLSGSIDIEAVADMKVETAERRSERDG